MPVISFLLGAALVVTQSTFAAAPAAREGLPIRPGRYVQADGSVIYVRPTSSPRVVRIDARGPTTRPDDEAALASTPELDVESDRVSFFYAADPGVGFFPQACPRGQWGDPIRRLTGLTPTLKMIDECLEANDPPWFLAAAGAPVEDSVINRLAGYFAGRAAGLDPGPLNLRARVAEEWTHRRDVLFRNEDRTIIHRHQAHPGMNHSRFRGDVSESLILRINSVTQHLRRLEFTQGDLKITCENLILK